MTSTIFFLFFLVGQSQLLLVSSQYTKHSNTPHMVTCLCSLHVSIISCVVLLCLVVWIGFGTHHRSHVVGSGLSYSTSSTRIDGLFCSNSCLFCMKLFVQENIPGVLFTNFILFLIYYHHLTWFNYWIGLNNSTHQTRSPPQLMNNNSPERFLQNNNMNTSLSLVNPEVAQIIVKQHNQPNLICRI